MTEDSLVVEVLTSASQQITQISRDVSEAADALLRWPVLWHWLRTTAQDPETLSFLVDVTWKLLIVFGSALGVSWLVTMLMRRPLALIEARIPLVARAPAKVVTAEVPPGGAPPEEVHELKRRRLNLTRVWQATIRVPFVLGRLILELLPVIAFSIVCTLLLSTEIGDAGVTRMAILAVVNAYLTYRVIVCLMRALFGPLSLFVVREDTAAYIELWTRRIVGLAAIGITIAKFAVLLGLYRAGYIAILRVVMLIAHLLVVVVILQCRHQVAAWLRPTKTSGFVPALWSRFARLWHIVAIGVVMGLWLVWALNIQNGFTLILQYLGGTLLALGVTRLAILVVLGLIDRGLRVRPDLLAKMPELDDRASRYRPALRKMVSTVGWVIGILVLLQLWGINSLSWFSGGEVGSRLVSAFFTVGIAAVVAAVAWEGSNFLMDRKLADLARDGHFARAARLRTFRPMIRTALLVIIIGIIALTTLSEIGVNIAPLLAGAGIVGIAVGFGSQKLVQDVITGLFLLLENVVQVGDNVTVSGLSGVVENVSIRTIRLRAGDGSVHVVPFSSVTTVTNASRGVGNVAVKVDVAADQDTDHVGKVLKEIVAAMRIDPDFEGRMRSDLDLWGVDRVDSLSATLVGQIRCTDSGKAAVQRELNRRMKERFEQEGIKLAAPAAAIVIQQAAPEPVVDAPALPRRVAN